MQTLPGNTREVSFLNLLERNFHRRGDLSLDREASVLDWRECLPKTDGADVGRKLA